MKNDPQETCIYLKYDTANCGPLLPPMIHPSGYEWTWGVAGEEETREIYRSIPADEWVEVSKEEHDAGVAAWQFVLMFLFRRAIAANHPAFRGYPAVDLKEAEKFLIELQVPVHYEFFDTDLRESLLRLTFTPSR